MDPAQEGSEHAVIKELPRASIQGFENGRLWITDSPEWDKFSWAAVDLVNARAPRLAHGTSTQRCANGNAALVGLHFASSIVDDTTLALCDITTGQKLGRLDVPPYSGVTAVNQDGTLAIVGTNYDILRGTRKSRFWYVRENRTVDIEIPLRAPVFAGMHTVVAQSTSSVVTVDTLNGSQSDGWQLKVDGESILAADAASHRVLVDGQPPTLRDLENGNVIARVPVRTLEAAAFGPNSLLVGTDYQRIWVWRLPTLDPVGELFVDSDGILLIASDGKFETTTPVSTWQASLACGLGAQSLPLKNCIDTLYQSGLIARIFTSRPQ